jgi:hypothetical protein
MLQNCIIENNTAECAKFFQKTKNIHPSLCVYEGYIPEIMADGEFCN